LRLQDLSILKQGAEAEDDEQDTPALFIQNRLLQSPPFVRLMAETPCAAQPGGRPRVFMSLSPHPYFPVLYPV